uniref:Uncharacterized protein n=1 Tax=Arundo donax TaxID=35708 RepID=A0A0A9GLC0_ARUDO
MILLVTCDIFLLGKWESIGSIL